MVSSLDGVLMEKPPKRKTYFEEDMVLRAWEQIDATCSFRYSKASIFLDTLESVLSAGQKCRRQERSVYLIMRRTVLLSEPFNSDYLGAIVCTSWKVQAKSMQPSPQMPTILLLLYACSMKTGVFKSSCINVALSPS